MFLLLLLLLFFFLHLPMKTVSIDLFIKKAIFEGVCTKSTLEFCLVAFWSHSQ